MPKVVWLFILPGVLALFPAFASSSVISVPSDYVSIQEGIDRAVDGDTVLVAPGEYHECLNFGGKHILVKSSSGPTQTVITGDSTAVLVTFDSGEDRRARLDGFTIRGGWMAVLCANSGPVISHNILVGQHVHSWAAIALAGDEYPSADYGASPAMIVNNVITGCANGAISSFSTEAPIIRNNIIAFNEGYGIHCQGDFLNVDVGYNNIYGNETALINVMWAGRGAMSSDPLFSSDYSLQGGSPCIDAGDPDETLNDPDGSRSDIGAVWIGSRSFPLATEINFGPDAVNRVVTGLRPLIYWTYDHPDGGSQAGYELELGTDLDWSDAEIWSTGSVMSADSVIEYGGRPLDDNSSYYLRIRLFDGEQWGDWQSHALRTRSYILVGGADNHPPYEFLDDDGQATGFNVELTKAIYEATGGRVEFRLGAPEDAHKALLSGELDVVMGMSQSYERDRFFDFSPAAAVVHHAIFARSGDDDITTIDELREREIIVIRGDIMHDFAAENGLSDKLVLTDTPQQALRLLASGNHEFALLGELTGLYWVSQLGLTDIKTTGPLFRPSQLCFAVHKGNMLQLARFSEGLAILKESGRYQEIYDQWLGVVESPRMSVVNFLKHAAAVLVPLMIILWGILLWTWSLKRKVAVRTHELNTELGERRRAEDALRQSEERYRSLHDNLPVGVYRADPSGRFQSANPAFAAMFGFGSVEEILETSAREFIENPDVIMPEILERLKAETSLSELELRMRHRDGHMIWTASSITLVSDESGKPLFLNGTIRDVTVRKEYEARARAADQEKYEQAKRISGVFAHEVRNALFPASAALSQMKRKRLSAEDSDAKERNLVDIAVQAIGNASAATRLISRFNKLDTEVMPEKVDFSGVVTDVLNLNRMRLKEEGISLGAGGDEGVFVRSNRLQLPMVFNNLLSNSQYALVDRPEPRIDVHWRANGEFVEMSFADNGAGIRAEDLRMIFEPFFSTKSHREGIGIGLATTRKILEMYGGSISASSVEGEGTRFDMKFRLYTDDPTDDTADSAGLG